MSTPKTNWILLALYAVLTLGVLIASIVSPTVRAVAYAPLRDLLIPPPKPIVISVLYSTEKGVVDGGGGGAFRQDENAHRWTTD